MKKLFTLLGLPLFILNSQVKAEATLTSLKVKEDIVYFSTDEAKIDISPSCMAAENADKWTLSLNTSTGKAIYALLVTATADKRKVTIESAGDCADVTGFERAIGVGLGQEVTNSVSASSTEFTSTFLSGVKYLAKYAKGTIITITPPEGQRARLNAFTTINNYAESNISIHIGDKIVVDNLTLNRSNSNIGKFNIASDSSTPYLQGEVGETIQIIKTTDMTRYPIYYSYSFSK
jgi:hypothetical protein